MWNLNSDKMDRGNSDVVNVSVRDQVREFLVGAAEMSVELAKGCRDIVRQSLEDENSFVVRNFGKNSYIGGKVVKFAEKLSFLNEYLPEDRDPLHAWPVILLVVFLAFAVLSLNFGSDDSLPPVKKVFIHPPNASRIQLPDGRYMAYKEQGVPTERARYFILAPHRFLSSRLAGIPGIKASLLEEFGVYLLTYDLPGFGESEPDPDRNLESSAYDMSNLVNALGIKDKFWVLGYSSGSMHAWAALKYIPDKISGAAMFAPMVNPYDPAMNKEEIRKTWGKWMRGRKFMFFLARRFPRLLPFFYRRSFLSGRHDQIDKWLLLSLGKRDRALVEDPIHEEFWHRDIEESIRQGDTRPFVEEASLLVSDWGFRLADLKLQKKQWGKGILEWLKRLKSLLIDKEDELTGFLGPIHIWQGMDDGVVPPAVTDFVHRQLPGIAVHKLPYEGHFTYLYFCDECHRQIFTTLFGTPQGPVNNTIEEVDQFLPEVDSEASEEVMQDNNNNNNNDNSTASTEIISSD